MKEYVLKGMKWVDGAAWSIAQGGMVHDGWHMAQGARRKAAWCLAYGGKVASRVDGL